MLPSRPADNGEGLQILRYVDGQHYEPHSDAFHDQYNQRIENGGQRIATVWLGAGHWAGGSSEDVLVGLPEQLLEGCPSYQEQHRQGKPVCPGLSRC